MSAIQHSYRVNHREMFDNFMQALDVAPKTPQTFCMSDADSKLLKGSRLYQEFLAEREEIMRHKWIESEKAGYDVGFEKCLLDWLVKYRADWRRKRKEQQQNTATA